jgi:hypothetical protein
MYIYSRLTMSSLPLIVGLTSCTHVSQDSFAAANVQHECPIGEPCTVEGEFFIYRGSPGSIAEIRTLNGCFAAAVAEDVYRNYRLWNGRTVRASGRVYRQNFAEDVVSYELNGRVIATGICPSGPLLFVETLSRR